MPELADVLKSIRPAQASFFVFLVLAGSFLGGELNAVLIIIRVLIAVFGWQFTVVLNDFCDEKLDRVAKNPNPLLDGVVSKRVYLRLGVAYLILTILFSFLLGNHILPLLAGLGIALSWVYSAPPFRMRRHFFGTVFIGAGSVVTFLIGFVGGVFAGIPTGITALMVLLFISVSVGTTIKDCNRSRGEKEAGIRNIFTIYGERTGKKIAAVLVFLSFMAPLIFLHEVRDIGTFLPLSLVSAYLFSRSRGFKKGVMPLSLLVMLYVLLRIAWML